MTNKKKQVETEGRLTSIITSRDELIDKDSLSREVRRIRNEISQLKKTEIEKIGILLRRFDELLGQNCARIRNKYVQHGCPDVIVEPAIGYFIPDINL